MSTFTANLHPENNCRGSNRSPGRTRPLPLTGSHAPCAAAGLFQGVSSVASLCFSIKLRRNCTFSGSSSVSLPLPQPATVYDAIEIGIVANGASKTQPFAKPIRYIELGKESCVCLGKESGLLPVEALDVLAELPDLLPVEASVCKEVGGVVVEERFDR